MSEEKQNACAMTGKRNLQAIFYPNLFLFISHLKAFGIAK